VGVPNDIPGEIQMRKFWWTPVVACTVCIIPLYPDAAPVGSSRSIAAPFEQIASSDAAVDRLSIPGPISFNGTSYQLSWSSHPNPNYYKQEYLPAGQTSEHFQRMVLIEAIAQGADVDGAVSAQVSMLNRRKSTDPNVNFAIVKNPNTGEMILDFILSAEDTKGGSVVEWNAYRYAALKDKDGNSGVLLFGVSRRAYGDDSTEFLRGLKSARPAEINALAHYRLPVVQLKN
jgi:hypothetical protein